MSEIIRCQVIEAQGDLLKVSTSLGPLWLPPEQVQTAAPPTVLVSVAARGSEWDVELPTALPVRALLPRLAQALGLPALARLSANPPGRALGPGETLALAGVPDGASLVVE